MDEVVINGAGRDVTVLNRALHAATGPTSIQGVSGIDFLGAGLMQPHRLTIEGSTGDYACANACRVEVLVKGSVGHGFGCGIEHGVIFVRGDAGDSCGAFAKAGLLVVEGNAGRRVAVCNEGADLVIRGNVGTQAAFRMINGNLIVLGNAAAGLGRELRGGSIYVRGQVESLSEVLEEHRLRESDKVKLSLIFLKAEIEDRQSGFRVFRKRESVHGK